MASAAPAATPEQLQQTPGPGQALAPEQPEKTQGTGDKTAEEELPPADPTEEDHEALAELRLRFDATDSEPLSRFREDIKIPRATDQLTSSICRTRAASTLTRNSLA